jgi:hypothetical protein
MMRKAQGISIAAFFILTLSTAAWPSPPNISDEQIIDSMQTMQLVPNTPSYAMWAKWIRTQIAHDTANYHDFKNGQFVAKVISTDLDLITIKTAVHTPSANSGPASHSQASLDGKSASLPISGEAGEHVTIVSQTTTTYLSWTYSWNTGAEGARGGWELTGSAFHDCEFLPNKQTGVRCERN